MSKNEELAPFTKVDWYGFAGATPFPEGEDKNPLIGSNERGVFIVDATGIGLTIYVSREDTQSDQNYYWNYDFKSANQARIIVHGIAIKFFEANCLGALMRLVEEVGFQPC